MTQVKQTTDHIRVSENYAKFLAKSKMKDKFGDNNDPGGYDDGYDERATK